MRCYFPVGRAKIVIIVRKHTARAEMQLLHRLKTIAMRAKLVRVPHMHNALGQHPRRTDHLFPGIFRTTCSMPKQEPFCPQSGAGLCRGLTLTTSPNDFPSNSQTFSFCLRIRPEQKERSTESTWARMALKWWVCHRCFMWEEVARLMFLTQTAVLAELNIIFMCCFCKVMYVSRLSL